MSGDDVLREQLLALVDGRGAHMPFEAAVAGFPPEAINRQPPNVPYTPWHLLEHAAHRGVHDVVQTINAVADEWPALWRRDNEPGGFQWLDADDSDHSMYAFARWDTAGAAAVICIANFTPLSRPGYRVGLPWGGAWRVVLDTDNAAFWGSGLRGLEDDVVTAADPAVPWQSLETSGQLDIGPMSMVWLASTAPPPPSTT